MAELDITRSLWVTEAQLGTVRVLWHRWKKISYRLPPRIESGSITLRFKGRGNTLNHQTGDLMVQVHVDRGHDLPAALWLSETEARTGCRKELGRRHQ